MKTQPGAVNGQNDQEDIALYIFHNNIFVGIGLLHLPINHKSVFIT